MKDIESIRADALKREIPIMKDDGIQYLCEFIRQQHIQTILEIGTAVGYSALCMAQVSDDIRVTTVEKDEARYREAQINIAECGFASRIVCHLADARQFICDHPVDLLFIDGAKTCNQAFFDRFSPLVKAGGYVVVDNIYFYGFVDDIAQVRTRKLRQLVKKIQRFKAFLLAHSDYEASYIQCGDGMIIAKKIR